LALLYPTESYIIRGLAFEIYKLFRNNHKEVIYHNAFYLGLKQKGLKVEKERRINVYYENNKVGTYTPNLIVNNSILVELKAKPKLTQEDIKQFWYYLKGSEYKLGFLINFGSAIGVEIIRRVYDIARDKNFKRGSACCSA
jgi:GxxExxY protein